MCMDRLDPVYAAIWILGHLHVYSGLCEHLEDYVPHREGNYWTVDDRKDLKVQQGFGYFNSSLAI